MSPTKSVDESLLLPSFDSSFPSLDTDNYSLDHLALLRARLNETPSFQDQTNFRSERLDNEAITLSEDRSDLSLNINMEGFRKEFADIQKQLNNSRNNMSKLQEEFRKNMQNLQFDSEVNNLARIQSEAAIQEQLRSNSLEFAAKLSAAKSELKSDIGQVRNLVLDQGEVLNTTRDELNKLMAANTASARTFTDEMVGNKASLRQMRNLQRSLKERQDIANEVNRRTAAHNEELLNIEQEAKVSLDAQRKAATANAIVAAKSATIAANDALLSASLLKEKESNVQEEMARIELARLQAENLAQIQAQQTRIQQEQLQRNHLQQQIQQQQQEQQMLLQRQQMQAQAASARTSAPATGSLLVQQPVGARTLYSTQESTTLPSGVKFDSSETKVKQVSQTRSQTQRGGIAAKRANIGHYRLQPQ